MSVAEIPEDLGAINKPTEKQYELRFNAQLEEYRAVRAEILVQIESLHQMFNYTLVGISALLAASKIILVDFQFPFLFLVSSFLFFAILWTQLRYAVTIQALVRYIENVLCVAIEETINELGTVSLSLKQPLFGWDSKWNKEAYTNIGLRPLEYARYVVTLVPAEVCFFVYWVYSTRTTQLEWYRDYALLVMNIGLLVYSLIAGFRMRRQLFENRSNNQE